MIVICMDVKDMKLKDLKTSDLLNQMKESGGFGAKNLGLALDIVKSMNSEKCIKFLSFPACIISSIRKYNYIK